LALNLSKRRQPLASDKRLASVPAKSQVSRIRNKGAIRKKGGYVVVLAGREKKLPIIEFKKRAKRVSCRDILRAALDRRGKGTGHGTARKA
jgi:hypothetical protein